MKKLTNKSPLLIQYFWIACHTYILYYLLFIPLQIKDGDLGELMGLHVVPLTISVLINYACMCFLIKKMTLYEDRIEVIYPTRPFARKKVFHYQNIKKFMLGNAKTYSIYRIYPLDSSSCSIGIGDNKTIKETLAFVKSRGVEIEVKGDADYKRKYTP